MKRRLIISILLFLILNTVFAADFYAVSYLETYRTDLNTTMVSPNIFFKYGRLDGFAFYDRYVEDPQFYHSELMLAYTPFTGKYLDKFSFIYESRWDKFANSETSFGVRFKLFEIAR